MSTFGYSRVILVLLQNRVSSENQSFLDDGATRLRQGLGVLGGQVPRLYAGTIFWGGGVTHLGGSGGA